MLCTRVLALHSLRYEERAALAQNAMGRSLLELMARKRTNLSVAVDVDTVEEMLDIADKVGPYVCVLKTHVDVFDSWSPSIADKLTALAAKHGAWRGVGVRDAVPAFRGAPAFCGAPAVYTRKSGARQVAWPPRRVSDRDCPGPLWLGGNTHEAEGHTHTDDDIV